MGSVDIVLPSRDSTRIVKHTFDAAKIRIITQFCKLFALFYSSRYRLITGSFCIYESFIDLNSSCNFASENFSINI